MILGIDEVGRGCWAGPLVVGAVILGEQSDRALMKDSKQLSLKKRVLAARHIQQTACDVGIGWASAKFIDTHGLSKALTYATEKAIEQIKEPYSEIILDGTVNFLKDRPVTLLAKADSLIPAVSAGSIIAKVARDNYMQAVDGHFVNYGFASHVGYGTAAHRKAIADYGPTPIHRMSFAPLSQMAPFVVLPKVSHTAGYLAERRAADFLKNQGYQILAQNWKTKWCEVDIIAEKQNVIYFIEVKYRLKDTAGRGLEYITPKKQRQMKFAAELWQLQQKSILPAQLAAIELAGDNFVVTEFIESIV